MPTATKTPLFLPEQFVPTQFSTAQDKADFANALADFILSGFPEAKFTKKLYGWLHQHFGMIAHYNQQQFFQEYFTSTNDKVRFIGELLAYPCYGDPSYTFSDMERDFISWLRKNGAAVARAIEGSVPPEEEIAWISIASVRRRLPVGTECVGEWLLQKKGAAGQTHRRRVTKQTGYEMVCEILDGPKARSAPSLLWAGVAAYEDGDAIVLRMKETGKDFLKITFPKEPAVESIGGD